MGKCTIESEREEYRESIRVARLRCRAAESLLLSRDNQLVRYVRGAEALVQELITREMSEESDQCDGREFEGPRKVYVSVNIDT